MGSVGMANARRKAMWLYPKVMGFNPSERWGHSACYYQGSVYFYGGCCGGLHFSDVVVLNLDTMAWKFMETVGEKPGPRDSHSAVLVNNKMIIFGGTNGSKKLNHLHILDLDTGEWTRPECKGNTPSPRESHSATLVGDDKIVIFGGSGEGEANYLNDLHLLQLQTMRWSKCETGGEIPVPRDSHSAVVVGHKFFVYGGDCGDQYHGDIEMLNMDSLTWSKFTVRGSSPGIRAGHTALNIGTKIYIIGGVGDRHYYSDAWVLDVSTCLWSQLMNVCGQKPQGRFSHTAVVADSDIVIYGGCGEDERPLNELLVLQLEDEHPNGRYNISMFKSFGNHWNHEKRESSSMKTSIVSGNTHAPESRTMQSSRFLSESYLHPKRRRTSTAPIMEAELEQEEHSLSLSQHSSPSLSDRDQTPIKKSNDSAASPRDFHFLTPSNISTQGQHVLDQMNLDAGLHNLIGAEVRGRVDGAFDSGFLIGASVNGKAFRGVLFPPAQGVFPRGSSVSSLVHWAHPISNSNRPEPFQHPRKQLMPYPSWENIHSLSHPHDQASMTRSMIRAAPSPCLVRESSKIKNDHEGVVLTLGGPGNCSGGSK